ncbi:MAG TPA: glycoside hydrolase family 2 TIM barrel-domain containing protein [Bryobacteraceae bacterium]|nr:glycoside hydrolase family 2 TIM barrel-domain containing protein [Bryobacteraceae bacterium]
MRSTLSITFGSPDVTVDSYPRPQLKRKDWLSLDGTWEFAIDAGGDCRTPDEPLWNQRIRVPFSPETPASGIADTSFYRACWYRRTFRFAPRNAGERLLLHFGAVDHHATVWINGHTACTHEGGYTSFFFDITNILSGDGDQTVVVRAEDDPADLSKPRGKQDWQLNPHSIWYPRTTGIWQTAWLERVPATYIDMIRWTPNLERWEIGFEIWTRGPQRDDLNCAVELHGAGRLLARDCYAVLAGEVHRRIALSDPGIDDYRNELLWSPATPTLITARIRLETPSGEIVDEVESYTALRQIGVQGEKFTLNNRPYQLRMVLDQGYWPESGLTAPDDDALHRDVELAKAMGFNGVRKHQKLEDPRYLYWADRLGLLVWEEMPSAYRFTRASVSRLTREWTEAIGRDVNHPCIVAWVPFNESWGVPDLPSTPAQRHYVQALYHLTKTLDPTRPVIGNDGWESVATDIIGIHDYDPQPSRILARYTAGDTSRLFKREQPAGRLLSLSEPAGDQPIMITEFGGIAFSPDVLHTWGYSRADSAEDLANRYLGLLRAIRAIPVLAGFCYTQFADTYQETNGLLFADRTPKFPLEEIALATRGPQTPHDHQLEWEWRERLMKQQQTRYVVPPEDHHTSQDPKP